MNKTWGPPSGQANAGGWVRKIPEYHDGPPPAYIPFDGELPYGSRDAFDIADVENRSLDKAKAKEKSTKF